VNVKTLADDFREIRRVGTPWTVIQTSDYRATIRELLTVSLPDESSPPAYVWNCVNGPQLIRGTGDELGTPDDPPSIILKNALQLPEHSILFFVVPDDFSTPNHSWTNPFTAQAAANLRDAFKTNRRTLVILSIDGKLPSLIADDVPVLRDPLPTKEELLTIAEKTIESANVKVPKPNLDKGVSLCLGMNRFAAEEAIARKLSRKGLDLAGLATAQREVIEQSSEKGLTFERGSETFDDIGGLGQIKRFSKLVFNGERPPTVVVRIEEIEKAMAGTGNDSTGVSQDQLGVLLTAMEDNDWTGFLAVGHAGSGKSLISKAMGNTHKVPSINFDLGAMKSKWIGDSEGKIRKSIAILKSFAGNGAYFIATSNDLQIIPPALRRRFRFGVFMFDLPTSEERASIWAINRKRFAIADNDVQPDDNDFTGSDIRNVCDLAMRLRCSLKEAVTFVVPVAKSDPGAIQRLRDSAHGKYLSATNPGAYRKPEQREGRTISI
jgi:hypothetical protein